jgi:hypothetical protein
MNPQCTESVFNFMAELEIPYSSKNLIGTCYCCCCGQQMKSAAEVAMNSEIEDADYKDPFSAYLYN